MAGEEDSHKWTVRIVYLITFINQGCMFVYLQYVPFIFTDTFHLDKLHFSYLQSIFAFIQLCVAPMLGRLADRIGTRAVLLICLTSSVCAHFILGSANSLTMCFVSRMASLLQDVMPVTQMIITDVVPEKDRSAALGRSMVPFSLGLVTGPLIAGFIAEKFGFQGVFLFTFWLPLLCIVMALVLLPKSTKQHTPEEGKTEQKGQTRMIDILTMPGVAFLLFTRLFSMLPTMLFAMNFNLVSVDIFGMTPSGIGTFYSFFGIINMVTHGFLVGFISKRVSSEKLTLYLPPLLIVFQFFLSWTTSIVQLMVVFIPLSVVGAVLENQTMTRLTKAVPKKDSISDKKADSPSRQTKIKDILFLPGVTYLLLVRFLSVLPNMMIGMNFNILSVDVFDITPSGIGILYSLYGMVIMVSHGFLVGFASRRFTTQQLLLYIPPVLTLGQFLLSLTTTITPFTVVSLTAGAVGAIIENQTLTRLTSLVPKSDTSTMVGLCTAVLAFTRAISPAAGGVLLTLYGWPSLGQFGVLCGILTSTLTFFNR